MTISRPRPKRGQGLRVIVLASLLVFGCKREPYQLADEPLVGGQLVRELLAPTGRTAVVIYDPATAFACSTDLAFWNDLRVRAPERLVVLVVSPARADDIRAMAMAGFAPRGVMTAEGSRASRLIGTYIFENGVVVAKARDAVQVARRRLWNHVLPGTALGVEKRT